ncbi:hypothetical protein COP2_023616 [Malus domestica]
MLQTGTRTVCQQATPANEFLAIHAMGNRPGKAYVACYWGQVHDDRGNQLLHQMGRSKAHEDHDSDVHKTLHMEEHHLPIWHPSVHRHRQRPAICGKRFGEVLPKVQHQSNTFPRQDILKVMGRPKHPTRRSSTASRNPSPTKRENGQMNSPDAYGHIAPPKDEQPVRLISLWHLVQKQSFLPTSSCQASTFYYQALSRTAKRWPQT